MGESEEHRIRVGVASWAFPGWRGTFYPKGLRVKDELKHASSRFHTLEVNATFYGLQRPSTFQKWFAETPEDFVFAVKGSQFVTHVLRLKEPIKGLSDFFASGVLALGAKLGPLLWQLPPSLEADPRTLTAFLDTLPKTWGEARSLAQRHSERLAGRTFLEIPDGIDAARPMRHALEPRHRSFLNAPILGALRAHQVAWVMAHAPGRAPYSEEITAPDFIYARMHGIGKAYSKGYPEAVLREWKAKLMAWSQTHDAFVVFSTEAKEHSPQDALNLIGLLEAR